MKHWRLLMTRPAGESDALVTRFVEAGAHAVSMPLLEIEPIELGAGQIEQIKSLHLYCAVIAVSKPAARLGLALIAQQGGVLDGQPWFSVGAGTGAVLQADGIAAQWPQNGEDSESLLALPALKAAARQPAARILILRGEGGREKLAEQLRRYGAQVDYLALYRRCLPAYAPGELLTRIEGERLNGIVVSSGQGFEHLRLLAGEDWPAVAQLTLFVPGPRVAQMARAGGAQHVVECGSINGAALMSILRSRPAPSATPDR